MELISSGVPLALALASVPNEGVAATYRSILSTGDPTSVVPSGWVPLAMVWSLADFRARVFVPFSMVLLFAESLGLDIPDFREATLRQVWSGALMVEEVG